MCKKPCGLKIHQTKVGCVQRVKALAHTRITHGKMQEEPSPKSSHSVHRKPPGGSSLQTTQTIRTPSGQVAPSQQGLQQVPKERPIVSTTPWTPSRSARPEKAEEEMELWNIRRKKVAVDQERRSVGGATLPEHKWGLDDPMGRLDESDVWNRMVSLRYLLHQRYLATQQQNCVLSWLVPQHV